MIRKLGYIGLGKMGINMVLSFGEHGIPVLAYNRSEAGRVAARRKGITVVDSLEDLIEELPKPRTVWLMVSSSGVDTVLKKIISLLSRGDTIIDGGN